MAGESALPFSPSRDTRFGATVNTCGAPRNEIASVVGVDGHPADRPDRGALLGAALPVINVAALTLLQHTTPNPLMGRVTAAFDLANTVPYTVSIALGAVLVTALPYQAVLGLVVTGCTLAALYATLTLHVRQASPRTASDPMASHDRPESIRSTQ